MNLEIENKSPEIGVVIITGNCCIPGMAPFDDRARQVVDQAITETGVAAKVKILPATTAYMGGAPQSVIAELLNMFGTTGKIGLPAILINGETAAYGVPELYEIKSALLKASKVEAM
jgi:hypothetical protein